ncbi:MAG: ABC transporter permease [Caulobacterales bacterium]
MDALRPYLAGFTVRFQQMLQYRAAALAGFATQCWWGAIKIMIYAAFFHANTHASSQISLSQVITYTWLAQAAFAIMPWNVDPDVALAVRTGAVSYDRLRPVDAYGWWFVRSAGWMTSRVAPRAALMFALAGIALPLLGFSAWAWAPPAGWQAAALFVLSLTLAVLLATAFTVLLNLIVVSTLTDRGVNLLATPVTLVLTGNILPLLLFPSWAQIALLVQPFAGVMDIPCRIYFGQLSGSSAWIGLGLQTFWIAVAVGLGRAWTGGQMAKLQVQGG